MRNTEHSDGRLLPRRKAFLTEHPELVHITPRAVHILKTIQGELNPHSFTQSELETEFDMRNVESSGDVLSGWIPLSAQLERLLAAGLLESDGEGGYALTQAGMEFEERPQELFPEEKE